MTVCRRMTSVFRGVLSLVVVILMASDVLAAKKKRPPPDPVKGQVNRLIGELQMFKAEPMTRSIKNLARRYDSYKKADEYIAKLPELVKKRDALIKRLNKYRRNAKGFEKESAENSSLASPQSVTAKGE